MKSENPKSGFYEAETSRCLDANGGKMCIRDRLLRRLGFLVFILDDESQILHILSEIGGDSGGV